MLNLPHTNICKSL